MPENQFLLPYSILNQPAMPASVKKITLVQIGVTMLLNTRPKLHSELRVSMMEQLAIKMMISGYPADFRRGVIESAVKYYEAQLAASLSGKKRTLSSTILAAGGEEAEDEDSRQDGLVQTS